MAKRLGAGMCPPSTGFLTPSTLIGQGGTLSREAWGCRNRPPLDGPQLVRPRQRRSDTRGGELMGIEWCVTKVHLPATMGARTDPWGAVQHQVGPPGGAWQADQRCLGLFCTREGQTWLANSRHSARIQTLIH